MPRQQHYFQNLYIWATISVLMIITGCVSQSKFDQLALDHQSTAEERDTLAEKNKTLNSQIEQLTIEKTQLNEDLARINQTLTQKKQELAALNEESALKTQKLNDIDEQLMQANSKLATTEQKLSLTNTQLEATKQEIEENSHLYDGLVKNLTSELAGKKIKIQEMKNGINVELSQDILFPAGSARLNKMGIDVITKVSETLKDIPHNIVVAGFTDNVPISGGLASKYPTNWELAGARAASVVRLLENNDVDSNKLTALSYGATKPISTNDTEEGRAQNRRIEIRLRPNK